MLPEAAIDPLEHSVFLRRLDARHPDWLPELAEQGRLASDSPPDQATLDATVAQFGLDPGLRRFRNREMLRITWRELGRIAPLQQTLHDLTELAERCLDTAIEHHVAALKTRFGHARTPDGAAVDLTILGLGKLGGRELNLSSDIDIIPCFRGAGQTDGPRSLANEQYFLRLTRQVIRSLGDITEDGFCFRVDTRLRPFGEAGPLVCSFGAMEQYYQREGRDWERYALVKARPVAGDRAGGESLLQDLQPFVYRRYIDFGAVEALRDMRGAIGDDARRQGRENDLKRGEGGIRDIEFLVQCLQLLRGGREPDLRQVGLIPALAALEQHDNLPADVVASLRADYTFLRQAENAVQGLNDQQVHTLPEDPEDLAHIAAIMGHQNSLALLNQVAETRRRVKDALAASFPEPDEPVATGPDWSTSDEPGVAGFRDRVARMALSQRAAGRLGRFMPMLLSRMANADTPAVVRDDLMELVAGVCRRSAYLALLVENPAALDRTLDLFTRSNWVATTVIRHPALLDELIDPALGLDPPRREDWAAHARRIRLSHAGPEAALESLNYLKKSASLRIAVGELSGNLDAGQAQQLLTGLAEELLVALVDLAGDILAERHGRLPDSGLSVVGYGTLGTAEMSYESDLDLIFLYRKGAQDSDGVRPLAPETWTTRLARRVLGLATTLTPAGRLYDIDTRLRPNGRAGLLVSSFDAFERYQRKDAWVWELQALVRGRPVAGDEADAKRFRAIRRDVLGAPRAPEPTIEAVRHMRERMREVLGGGDPLKQGDGGLVDIGFVAQLGVLLTADRAPAVLDAVGTLATLKALQETGWLTADEATLLSTTHQQLVEARHHFALARAPGDALPDTADSHRLCRERMGDTDPAVPGGLE